MDRGRRQGRLSWQSAGDGGWGRPGDRQADRLKHRERHKKNCHSVFFGRSLVITWLWLTTERGCAASISFGPNWKP